MMIKRAGGWVSVRHAQAITPQEKKAGSRVQLIDGVIELEDDPDELAAQINEVRAAELTLSLNDPAEIAKAMDFLYKLAGLKTPEKKEDPNDETL